MTGRRRSRLCLTRKLKITSNSTGRSGPRPPSTAPAVDFGIGKRLHNLPALAEIGFQANRRLLHAQRLSHDPVNGAGTLAAITSPVITTAGTRVPGLRFGDLRAHALLAALCAFRLLPHGFANRDLRPLIAQFLGKPPEAITSGQMSYDLRRLRMHGLIQRIPHTHR